MKNYIDGKGNYHNEQNLTLAQIYDSGVEFGCKVTAEDKAEDIINELEKIKEEIKVKRDKLDNNPTLYVQCKMQGYSDSMGILEKHIAELKGEQK